MDRLCSIRTLERLLPALCACGLAWFIVVDSRFSVLELGRFLLGALALWVPFGGIIYLSLGSSCRNPLDRFTFGAIASHSLTTLAYHFCSVLQLWLPRFEQMFYVAQGLCLAAALGYVLKCRFAGRLKLNDPAPIRIDWILTSLIVMSLLVTARYKSPLELLPGTADRHFVAEPDQSYFAAQVYELGRGVPPLQQATRAGVRERAYHTYPHLTAMLLARFTGQPEMLRAEMLYEYTVLDVLMSLAVFCMTRTIIGSPIASYFAVALLYLFAVPVPPVDPRYSANSFYYTFYPHATSNLEPVLMTSPQMYTGLLVVYGIFLGVLHLSANIRHNRPITALALVTAAMVGTLIRFRVQAFLPMIPAFAAVLLVGCRQCRPSRRWIFLAAGVVSLLVVAANAFEMKLDVYLPHSTEVKLTNNMLSFDNHFFSSWPLGVTIRDILVRRLPKTVSPWAWQILCMPMFTLLNIVGVPLLIASGFYFRSRHARSSNLLFSVLLIGLVVFSILGATFLAMGYDPYSVGGQMTLHVGWYLFPLQAIGVWLAAGHTGRLLIRRQDDHVLAAILLLVAACAWQRVRPPSCMEQIIRERKITIPAEQWAMLMHMRQELPPASVVLARNNAFRTMCLISGIGGRPAYLEYATGGMVTDRLLEPQDTTEGRTALIDAIWKSQKSAEFYEHLAATQATYICECADDPFVLSEPDCLRKVWVSDGGKWTLWERRSE